MVGANSLCRQDIVCLIALGHITKSWRATSARSSSAMLRELNFHFPCHHDYILTVIKLIALRLELYFSDKRNFLIVFKDKRERQNVLNRMSYRNDPREAISRSVIGNFVLDTVTKAIDRADLQLEIMTKKWQQREISNVSGPLFTHGHAAERKSVRLLAAAEPTCQPHA